MRFPKLAALGLGALLPLSLLFSQPGCGDDDAPMGPSYCDVPEGTYSIPFLSMKPLLDELAGDSKAVTFSFGAGALGSVFPGFSGALAVRFNTNGVTLTAAGGTANGTVTSSGASCTFTVGSGITGLNAGTYTTPCRFLLTFGADYEVPQGGEQDEDFALSLGGAVSGVQSLLVYWESWDDDTSLTASTPLDEVELFTLEGACGAASSGSITVS